MQQLHLRTATLVSTSRAWPNAAVKLFTVERLVGLLLIGACAPSPGAAPAAAPLELASPTAPAEPPATDDGETRLPSAFQPCTEEDPSGCKAPQARRDALEADKRYEVAVRVDDPALGPADARVTLVVFSDYQCPFCAQLEPVLDDLQTRFAKEIRIVWKDLPLSVHEFALPAALLSREAFIEYGNERFWHVHRELFLHQTSFSDGWFAEFAKNEKLTWPADFTYQARVQQNVDQADVLSIVATPTVFVNGRPVVGARHVSVYVDLINEELGR